MSPQACLDILRSRRADRWRGKRPGMRPGVGAGMVPGEGARFCDWTPGRREARVVLEVGPAEVALNSEGNGHFAWFVAGVGAGARDRHRLDEAGPFPHPASRFQPEGPHGPSTAVDPGSFRWSDAGWTGVALP